MGNPAHGEYDPRISVKGEGQPLVLVPGMDGTGLLFYRQVPLLARRFRVATYRLRDDAGRMEVLVDDLAGVVDRVSNAGRPALLVGESFGGALSMSFALRCPERAAGLVVVNSFPHFRPHLRLNLAIYGLRVVPWGAMRLVRNLTGFRMHSRYTHRDEIRRFKELTARATKRGYIDRLRILRDYDVLEELADLRIPTLFLAADEDHLVPAVKQAELMANRVPGARVRVLSGHGHVCLIAPNVDLAQIIAEWRAAKP
jgi:pimeloyl-ACP methyl ester carboxylesterase